MDVRSNLAYNYNAFEEKQTIKKPEIKQITAKKVVSKGVSPFKAACYVLTVVVVLGIIIYGRATQAELEAQYTKTVKEMSQLANENIILQNQIESKLSIKNIEEIAQNQLGLIKVDNSQIECINFNIESKAEVVKKQTIWSSVSGWVTSLFQ